MHEATIYNNIESAISLFISFVISAAVIATFAAYVALQGDKDVSLDLLSASAALESFFG